jgi:ribosomal protein S21|tara:strand:+ start:1693 stop:1944 length:252 start_codon:yes stop_codon:yes gene_type:complete
MKNHRRKNNDDWNRTGLQVNVVNNDVTKAMRKLKKKISEDGLMQELRKREYFESKGTRRRLAKKAAIRRYKRNQAKLKEQLGY